MIAEFALFVFTTLGGLAAGLYIMAVLFPLEGKRNNLLLSVVPLVLLGIGGVALLMHLGHPERMFNAFANPEAGITQEGITTTLFGIVLVVDLALTWFKDGAPRALRIVGAVFAALLICAMGLLYYNYQSMPMWHALPTVPLFVVGDLARGGLLVAALDEAAAQKKALATANAVLAVLLAATLVGNAVVFQGCELSPIPFAIAAVVAAAVAVYLFTNGQKAAANLRWVLFAALFVGIIIARYAFYAAF
jgi:anaerobic dimethyl sulfoxide reductase subunit C (anchor subunit)